MAAPNTNYELKQSTQSFTEFPYIRLSNICSLQKINFFFKYAYFHPICGPFDCDARSSGPTRPLSMLPIATDVSEDHTAPNF